MKHFILSIFLVLSVLGWSQTDQNKSLKGIAIYIDYPDAPAPAVDNFERLNNLLNNPSYTEPTVPRSFIKYWQDETKRNLNITHDIFFYRSPLPTTSFQNYTQTLEMWRGALEQIISDNPNYDWDKLSINEIYGGIHSVMVLSSAQIPGIGAAHSPIWFPFSNGKRVRKINGSRIIRGGGPSLFVTIHEAAHSIFNFPDTYDTGGNSLGTASYSLMSGGHGEIEPIGAPFNVEKNWGNITELSEGSHTITLEADKDNYVVIKNPDDANEFFSIEVRAKENIGNEDFPVDLGLMIWHTDNNVTTSNTQEAMLPNAHYRHSIEQADGLFELENTIGANGGKVVDGGTFRRDSDDIYTSGDSFGDSTLPNSKWWNGSSSNFNLDNIVLNNSNNSITFDVSFGEDSSCDWTTIANEGEIMNFSGTKTIRYGANGVYNTKTVTSGTRCGNAVFGDAIAGVVKTCQECKDSNSTATTTTDGTLVHITKRNATRYAIDGGTGGTNGQNATLSVSNTEDEGQLWVEIDRGNGFYSYEKFGTNYSLDGGSGGVTRQSVYIWQTNATNQNQQWQKQAVGDGGYKLIKRNATGFAINGGSGGVEGRDINLWDSASTNRNLQWYITPINETDDGRLEVVDVRLEAEDYDNMSGIQTEASSESGDNVGYINNGDWIRFDDVNLSGITNMDARVATRTAGGIIEVRSGSVTGTLIGSINVSNTGGYQNWTTLNTSISNASGTQDVYLVFTGGNGYLFNVNWVEFNTSSRSNKDIDEVLTSTSAVKLYPNPVVSSVTIENAANSILNIYDMNGSTIFTKTISNESEVIDLSGLVTGMYYGEVIEGESITVIKIVKE